jgi:hypothetical protein
MLVLEIRKLNSDTEDPVARLWLKSGKIDGDGSEILLNSLREGVQGADGKTYTPKDGVGFLKAIQESYAGSDRMVARLVSKQL